MSLTNQKNLGFFRVASASPELNVADCTFNSENIIKIVKDAASKKVSLLVFPELSITAYTCQDLFLQTELRKSALESLEKIADSTSSTDVLFSVGLPLQYKNALYNCAAWIFQGQVLALIPKTFIPNYGEFYERRWFSPAPVNKIEYITLSEKLQDIPFGTNIIIEDEENSLLKIAIEICEDLWVPLSPSTRHALNGATVIANLSAGNEITGKAEYRKELIKGQSAKTISAYIYANAGKDESTTDMIFSGHSLIAQNGSIIAESKPFESKELIIADIDLEKLSQDRIRTTSFAQCENEAKIFSKENYISIFVNFQEEDGRAQSGDIMAFIDSHPFVPGRNEEKEERCRQVIEMQANGLAKRLRHIKGKTAVIGLSGGLDSTLALLVTAKAFDLCSLDRKGIIAVTMPCFGTTDRTYANACTLARETGASLKEIDIKNAVKLHFKDIGQDENIKDITYENCQARERTQVLMDLANKNSALVIGTGDLSELALGWCTYNGDQMSMYGVNSSIPKTLVRHLVSWFAEKEAENGNEKYAAVLTDILNTPVSPELIPPEEGKISQITEDIVGPYELHDFILYYVLRWGFSPRKIFYLASHVFNEKKAEGNCITYTNEIIFKWLNSFYTRFFAQQFKRSCMPDGAKVGSVNLSPRGDWRMPSDASSSGWKKDLEKLKEELGF